MGNQDLRHVKRVQVPVKLHNRRQVRPGEWFVKHNHGGPHCHDRHEADEMPLTLRKGVNCPVRPSFVPKPRQRLQRTLPGIPLRVTELRNTKRNFFADSWKDNLVIWVLEDDPNCFDCILAISPDIYAIDADFAGGRFDQSADESGKG